MHYVPNCPTNHKNTELKEKIYTDIATGTVTTEAHAWCNDCHSWLEECDHRAISTINEMYATLEKKIKERRYAHAT